MSRKNEPWTVLEPGHPHPLGWKVPPIDDLRSAIEHLKTIPGQYTETDHEVDPRPSLPECIATLARVARSCGRPASGRR